VTPVDGAKSESRRLATEIDAIRADIGALVDELDRRRREVFDVRLHARRHPVAAAAAGVALVAFLGGSVALLVHNERRKRRASYKARQLRIALGRMMEHPERVARGEPPPGEKILAAVGTAAATLLVRRALERALPVPRPASLREAEARQRA
jgi:hypothetical protein